MALVGKPSFSASTKEQTNAPLEKNMFHFFNFDVHYSLFCKGLACEKYVV